ncbi:MAG: S8 family serine peptidase [Armatimonadota bacterium]
MPRRILTAAVVTLLIAAGALPVRAQSLSSAEVASAYFIQLEGAPVAALRRGTPASAVAGQLARLARERQDFRRNARAAGAAFRERQSFHTLFNGLSVDASPAQVTALARVAGVRAVFPVLRHSLPPTTTSTSDPQLQTALAMTGADVVQSELGLSGFGVKVAVMDTGIDYDHPDLGGPGPFPTERVITGFDFVGDNFDAGGPPAQQIPKPDPDPDDCNGHGTHVAGIVGARAAGTPGATGVAPWVQFGAYRVFGCDGSTFSDIMIAAMEMILGDGMDVLNMSIGSARQWPQHPTSVASDILVENGVVVVASFGNSGTEGLYSGGSPGLGSKVIGVGSVDNTHINALSFNANPGGRQVAYIPLATTPDPPTSGTSAEVVFVGQGCLADPYLVDPRGKVALIVRGVCTFNEKYQRAFAAGASGVIIHNNTPGLFSGGGVTPRAIFGVGISQADGTHIRGLTGSVTVTWTAVRINAPNPTGGVSSSFTSYGLSPDLAVKPDITAPGGLIRSTYPLELGAYRTISGTSMSSPHVAGAVALLLEDSPGFPTELVRDKLMNNASPILWFGNPGLGFLDNVHRQGAGLLNISQAVRKNRLVTPGKLALGEGTGPVTKRLTIHNGDNIELTFDLSHRAALATGPNTFVPAFFNAPASVSFSASSVAVPAGSSRTVDVTITPNAALADRSLYGGYIVLTPREGGSRPRMVVPYAGFKGDYQSIQALVPTTNGRVPCLAKVRSLPFNDGQCVPPGAPEVTFNPKEEPLFIFVHLDHQVQRLVIEVFTHPNGLPIGRVFRQDFLPRNASRSSFFVLAWDGRDPDGKLVPDGFYRVRTTIQKALGDPLNPAHFESHTFSPPVRVLTAPAP